MSNKQFKSNRGFILEVPYEDKDEAKELGAWWDPDIKKWFVRTGEDPAPFSKWFPEEQEDQGIAG